MDNQFYSTLKAITTFTDVVNSDVYTQLPDNWSIISSDVRSSTKAIKKGKYKEVNMAGACIIAAISNYFKPLEIPFIFGGDGSTIAIPPCDIDEINGILSYSQQAVKDVYDLDLATGCISMKEIRDAGYDISVAKYELSKHVRQAIFWGNGTEYVERKIKSDSWIVSRTKVVDADFSGLECRWNEIPSKKDEVVAIIIKVMDQCDVEKSALYSQILTKIEQIYGEQINHRPVEIDQLKLAGRPTLLGAELKIRSYPTTAWAYLTYFLKLYYIQIVGWILMKFNITTSKTDWANYKQDFVQHADYRKFSDALRLVISGTIEQRHQLQEYLDQLFEERKAAFGIHSSFAALTTCYVTSYQHNHIHFIDGSDGGYAKASQDLKTRLTKLNRLKSES